MDLLKHVARSWAQYRSFRTTLAELQACSDRQLADMGFERGDLVRVAYEAAERHAGIVPTARDGGGKLAARPLRETATAAG